MISQSKNTTHTFRVSLFNLLSCDVDLKFFVNHIYFCTILRSMTIQLMRQYVHVILSVLDESEKLHAVCSRLVEIGLSRDKLIMTRICKALKYKCAVADGSIISMHMYVERMSKMQRTIFYVLEEFRSSVQSRHCFAIFNTLEVEILVIETEQSTRISHFLILERGYTPTF